VRAWRAAAAATILGAILTTACSGPDRSPTAAPTPAPSQASGAVVLDSSSFDGLVIASGRSCLVEFQNPT
jgi:hypothetical protein